MGVHMAIGDIRILRSILASLFVLVTLAERAAARSYPIRFLVLCYLRYAEAAASELVADTTFARRLAGAAAIGNDPGDAIRLALRFRALAAALVALLRPACRFGGLLERPDRVVRQAASCPGPRSFMFDGRDPTPNDTS